jgi:hypothetical protein
MESQNRQLVLAREVVRSPAEMKRIATNKGFRQRETVVIPVAANSIAHSTPLVERTSLIKPSVAGPKPIKAFLPTGARPTGQAFDSRPRTAPPKANERSADKLR